jgi:hypothetical protein
MSQTGAGKRWAAALVCVFASLAAYGQQKQSGKAEKQPEEQRAGFVNGVYRGIDRNEYPGDDNMKTLHRTFAFTGYWLTPPPGENSNSWQGHRAALFRQGWGFLLLANGKLDDEILAAKNVGILPAQLGRQDAQAAIESAKSEGFPKHAILFLDQEEGGRLLAEQVDYLLGWTEAVAASGYWPGVYASGIEVPDGVPGKKIHTIQHIRTIVKERHLHTVAFFDYQDGCPPAPGCKLAAKPLSATGEPDLTAWQYAQSPRRPEITKACAKTYAADGNCYDPALPFVELDFDVAATADPSNGR